MMVYFTISEKSGATLKELATQLTLPESLIRVQESLQDPPGDELILEADALTELSAWARTDEARLELQRLQIDPNCLTMAVLLEDAKVYIPPVTESRRFTLSSSASATLTGYGSKLYQIPTEREDTTTTPAQEWREAARQMSAVVNVLVSMFAVATAAWWASSALGGNGQGAIGIRVLFALSASLFIGAAETFLYYRFFNRRSAKLKQHGQTRPSDPTIDSKTITSVEVPSVRKESRSQLRLRAIANAGQKAGHDLSELQRSPSRRNKKDK